MADWLADGPSWTGPGSRTRGLSAGGLLQGGVSRPRPERWRAVVAEVPFVDVVTTMLDPTIPLTVNEWDEWGDPASRTSTSLSCGRTPRTTTCRRRPRPALLVTGAVHDPRVMVHEPAKWVARLRATGGPATGRCCSGSSSAPAPTPARPAATPHYRYEAEVLAWLLDALGVRAQSSV